jgi:hypothetical protein
MVEVIYIILILGKIVSTLEEIPIMYDWTIEVLYIVYIYICIW